MIIDTHAHALDEAFLQGLCRTPRFGLSADRDTAGRFCVRRGDGAPVSLDDELSNIPRRIESLGRRDVGLQLIGPPPGFASWPGHDLRRLPRALSAAEDPARPWRRRTSVP